MAQVKFYSVNALPETASTTGAGGIYFVTGGELYKGTSRFGANKVFTVPANTTITGETAEAKLSAALTAAGVSANNANAIGGDILTGYGAAKVFNGTTWIDLGQDQAALDEQLAALVSGLTFASNTGSYITGITQGADGKVTASTSNFATDVKTAIGDGAASSTANGITVSVTTTSGSVTGVQVAAANIEATSVSAASGSFTNLTVSDTATFSATTVSATTLTVGGVDVSNIAATSASDNDAGIAVTVSTANGGVTGVDVVVTSATLLQSLALSDFTGKTVVASAVGIADATNAVDTKIPTEAAVRKAIDDKVASLDNAMHYIGITETSEMTQGWTGTPTITGKTYSEKQAGDIVLKGTQEFIWNGSAWEIVGDQSAVTGGTSTSTVNDVTVTVVTAAATAFPSVTLSGVGTAASKNYADSLTSTGTSLPTESAVAGYVTGVIDALAGSASDADKGVSVQVVTADGQVSTVEVSVTAVSTMAFGATGSADELATTAAVKSYVENNLVWLDASGAAIA